MSEPLQEQPFVPAETPGQEEPAVEPEPFQIDQDAWNQMQQNQEYLIGQLNQLAQLAQPQDQGQIQLPEDSLLSPQDLEVIAQIVQQQTAPFQRMYQSYEYDTGMSLAKDILADDVSRNGDFLLEGSKEKAIALAESNLQTFTQQYGAQRAPEMAIEHAAAQVREWEQEVGKAYMEREQNELATLAGAPRSPAQPGRPAQQQLTTVQGGNEFNVLEKYFPGANPF